MVVAVIFFLVALVAQGGGWSLTREVARGSARASRCLSVLPFGEEVGAGVGGRTQSQGYSLPDGVRQQYAGSERDGETGLDFMQARYYSSAQGRFISPDLPFADQHVTDPQSWNLYTYVRNNPLRYNDPTGRGIGDFFERLGNWLSDDLWMTDQEIRQEGARAQEQIAREFVWIDNEGNQRSFDTSQMTNQQIIHFRNGLVTRRENGEIRIVDQINPTGDPVSPPAGATRRPSNVNNSGQPSEPRQPMLGERGTQVTSRTLWRGRGRERIDVENPNPGQRPGQIHYQDNAGNKYLYDAASRTFPGAPNRVNNLLNNPRFRAAIERGLRDYLGEQ